MTARMSRMKKECEMMACSPPPGVLCYPVEDKLDHLEAILTGPPNTPYKGGMFTVDVLIPERYPFEPPKLVFRTPIYHPNIDDGGRICVDILKMPPSGAWKPSLNVASVLSSLLVLLANANPDNGLMVDISRQYKCDRGLFDATALLWTQKHAMESKGTYSTKCATSSNLEKSVVESPSDSSSSSESDEDDSTAIIKKRKVDTAGLD